MPIARCCFLGIRTITMLKVINTLCFYATDSYMQ